jgi:hypothetical protein
VCNEQLRLKEGQVTLRESLHGPRAPPQLCLLILF